MKRSLILCLIGAGLPGCREALAPFVPDTRTAADRAHEVEPKCGRFSEESAAPLLAADAIERVEPELTYVQAGNDRRANLHGAHLYLRPMPNWSAEVITRSLVCHQARAALGQIEPHANDPYVLPGRWLDIGARSDSDGFSVTVAIDVIDDAKRVLDRAERYCGGACR